MMSFSILILMRSPKAHGEGVAVIVHPNHADRSLQYDLLKSVHLRVCWSCTVSAETCLVPVTSPSSYGKTPRCSQASRETSSLQGILVFP